MKKPLSVEAMLRRLVLKTDHKEPILSKQLIVIVQFVLEFLPVMTYMPDDIQITLKNSN